MCTYLTEVAEVHGVALAGEPLKLEQAVVSFDHPQEAPMEHALCIDFRSSDPSRRVGIELDAVSARRLAERILSVLDDLETRSLER